MNDLWKAEGNSDSIVKWKFKTEMAKDKGLSSTMNSELKNSIIEKVSEELYDQTITKSVSKRSSVVSSDVPDISVVTEMKQQAEFDGLMKEMVKYTPINHI